MRSATAEEARAAAQSGAEQAALISRAVAAEGRGTVAAHTVAELEKVRSQSCNTVNGDCR